MISFPQINGKGEEKKEYRLDETQDSNQIQIVDMCQSWFEPIIKEYWGSWGGHRNTR